MAANFGPFTGVVSTWMKWLQSHPEKADMERAQQMVRIFHWGKLMVQTNLVNSTTWASSVLASGLATCGYDLVGKGEAETANESKVVAAREWMSLVNTAFDIPTSEARALPTPQNSAEQGLRKEKAANEMISCPFCQAAGVDIVVTAPGPEVMDHVVVCPEKSINQTCPVCLVEFTLRNSGVQQMVPLNCGHLVCQECLALLPRALMHSTNVRCQVCRAPTNRRKVRPLVLSA